MLKQSHRKLVYVTGGAEAKFNIDQPLSQRGVASGGGLNQGRKLKIINPTG